MDEANDLEYCQWCGCELNDRNRVELEEKAEAGKKVWLCDECATNLFMLNNGDMPC